MSSRAKRTDINDRSRRLTHERDGYRCVYCGRTDKPIELAHYISRSKGGLGIPRNLVSLCVDCHRSYDGAEHSRIKPFLADYLMSVYEDWSEDGLIYRKE